MGRGARRLALGSLVVAFAPLAMGARGGCGPATSTDPAPDVNGVWAVSYDDMLDVEVAIGGAVYNATVPASGGTVNVVHGGFSFDFSIDCARPEVVCPSEAWPTSVTAEQREPAYPHRMWVRIPHQECVGTLRDPLPEECGANTLNPECDQVCDGEVTTVERDTFGLINEAGTEFDLLLGAGVATNGVNCLLLGISSAHATIESTGSATEEPWIAQTMSNGEVVAAYGGGCLWINETTDETQTGLVLAASLRLTTGFTAARE